MGAFHHRHFLRRARGDHLPAFLAAFRTEIDDPVGAFHHLQIVLDHDDRIARLDQALKQPNEKRDIVEMQPGGRLVEDEKIALRVSLRAALGQMPDELEPLRFAAGQGVERLTETEIAEPDFLQNGERLREFFAFA